MKHKLDHPHDAQTWALYGWDRALGFFVEIVDAANATFGYDRRMPGYDGLSGALEVLADHGFYRRQDIADAHGRLAYFSPDEIDDPSVARCARVIQHLRRNG